MDKKTKVGIIIALNLAVVVMEVISGLYANSVSLIADAMHNLGDVLAVTVTFVALLLAAKQASERMTFGYMRAEMMAGFLNALFLLFSMAFILYESAEKLLAPQEVKSEYMMIVALVALVANGISAWLLNTIGREYAHHHGHEHHDHRHASDGNHHDLNIRSAYLHMLSDAMISFGVILGGAAIYFFGVYLIDPLLSVLFSLFIVKETLGVLKRTFLSLIDINTDDLESIKALIGECDKVHSIHDLHLYRPSSKEMYLTSHLVFDENLTLSQIEEVLLGLRSKLKRAGVTHSVLQPETLSMAQENILCSDHP